MGTALARLRAHFQWYALRKPIDARWGRLAPEMDTVGRWRLGAPGGWLLVLLLVGAAGPTTVAAQTSEWGGADKAAHFAVGAGVAMLGYGAAALLTESRPLRIVSGMSLALAAGLTKELIDLARYGHFSGPDLVYTLLGGAVGVALAWLIDWAVTDRPPATAESGHLLHAPQLTLGDYRLGFH